MHGRTLAILVTLGFSGVGVIGDYFLKLASQRADSLRSGSFYIGFAVYAATAFGWVFAMKHLQLATIGALYSVTIVLLLTVLGVVRFGESLNAPEVLGLLMAVGALILLSRFG